MEGNNRYVGLNGEDIKIIRINFSFIIVSFSLTSAGLVHAMMEKFQCPNNTFQINFNDQIPKINFVSSDFVMGKT
jgi:hypothetical protein